MIVNLMNEIIRLKMKSYAWKMNQNDLTVFNRKEKQ